MKRSLAWMLGLAGSLAVAGCGGGSSAVDMGPGGTADVTSAHGDKYKYAVNSLLVPMAKADYSIDLNGDTRVDNALGAIISAIVSAGSGMFDVQKQVDVSVQGGSVLLLVELQTADAMLKSDGEVGAKFNLGKEMKGMPNGDGGVTGGPDFTGNGTFTIDTTQSAAQFFGKLTAGKFKSNNPITTTHPANITIQLALVEGSSPISLIVNGAHVEFTTGTDMTSGAPGLLSGQLHGSIKNSDVQGNIIPAVADLLTANIAKDPTSGTAMMLQNLFDTGGCGTAKAKDGKIETCEVANNNIIANVLAPDIDVYDAGGNYAPNKLNADKDSLSLGLGFTAVKATY